MKKVTPQPIFGLDMPDSVLRLCREYSEALNQLADHRFSEFVQVSGSYTAGENDHVIECSPSGAMTVTLPAASVMRNKRVVVKRANNTTHTITIQSSSGTIDDAASVTLTTAYQSREVFSDGVEWWLLDTTASAPTDPYWGDVILLLNGSGTVSTDSSSYGQTITTNGTPTLDSGYQIFGVDSIKIDASSNDRLQISNTFFSSAAGSDEWCWEYMIDITAWGANEFINAVGGLWLAYTSAEKFGASVYFGGGSTTMASSNTFSTSSGLHHVAVVRDNTTDATFTILRLYVDGVQEASSGGHVKTNTMDSSGFGWLLGYGGDAHAFRVQHMRVTLGTARYYAGTTFTPPSAPFPTS